ncbi:hypothetical protein ElyMa_000247500 [Elysia marginata]|uniref:Uncharacterized protein n=1 Tax=Elysia marginata TaxID=1093978 RepID=A0AAV4F368_9GAST|nr:hypothetical protein ElyMa_000247500 [Elysia marginata]
MLPVAKLGVMLPQTRELAKLNAVIQRDTDDLYNFRTLAANSRRPCQELVVNLSRVGDHVLLELGVLQDAVCGTGCVLDGRLLASLMRLILILHWTRIQ